MRIGAASTAYVAAQQVAPQRTPVTRADLRAAIGRALERVDGRTPPSTLVDTLSAHASLETANGDQMYNFNFGGIKGRSPTGETASCRTHEVVGGKDVVIRDGFRAYRTLDEGALDYVKTMKARFGAALEPASRGDAAGFAHALKKAGYYTASEQDYANAMQRLLGSKPADAHATTIKTAASPLTSEGVAKVDDALDAIRWMGAPHRHRAEDEDDDS